MGVSLMVSKKGFVKVSMIVFVLVAAMSLFLLISSGNADSKEDSVKFVGAGCNADRFCHQIYEICNVGDEAISLDDTNAFNIHFKDEDGKEDKALKKEKDETKIKEVTLGKNKVKNLEVEVQEETEGDIVDHIVYGKRTYHIQTCDNETGTCETEDIVVEDVVNDTVTKKGKIKSWKPQKLKKITLEPGECKQIKINAYVKGKVDLVIELNDYLATKYFWWDPDGDFVDDFNRPANDTIGDGSAWQEDDNNNAVDLDSGHFLRIDAIVGEDKYVWHNLSEAHREGTVIIEFALKQDRDGYGPYLGNGHYQAPVYFTNNTNVNHGEPLEVSFVVSHTGTNANPNGDIYYSDSTNNRTWTLLTSTTELYADDSFPSQYWYWVRIVADWDNHNWSLYVNHMNNDGTWGDGIANATNQGMGCSYSCPTKYMVLGWGYGNNYGTYNLANLSIRSVVPEPEYSLEGNSSPIITDLTANYSTTYSNISWNLDKEGNGSVCYYKDMPTIDYLVYQEDPNSTSYTNYTFLEDFPAERVFDGTWADDYSFAYPINTSLDNATIYTNYTKPNSPFLIGATYKLSWYSNRYGPANITVNDSCWNADNTTLRFMILLNLTRHQVKWSCWNGTSWTILSYSDNSSVTNTRAYEEALWWKYYYPPIENQTCIYDYNLKFNHSFFIGPLLENGTAYNYNVTSCYPAENGGNCTSINSSFETLFSDGNGTSITELSSFVITQNMVVINWTTPNEVNGTVCYGIESLGNCTSHSSLSTNHTVVLYNLSSNLSYQYESISCVHTPSNNCTSNTGNFTTFSLIQDGFWWNQQGDFIDNFNRPNGSSIGDPNIWGEDDSGYAIQIENNHAKFDLINTYDKYVWHNLSSDHLSGERVTIMFAMKKDLKGHCCNQGTSTNIMTYEFGNETHAKPGTANNNAFAVAIEGTDANPEQGYIYYSDGGVINTLTTATRMYDDKSFPSKYWYWVKIVANFTSRIWNLSVYNMTEDGNIGNHIASTTNIGMKPSTPIKYFAWGGGPTLIYGTVRLANFSISSE